MEFTLVTARTMEQGMYIDEKFSDDYFKATACCEMNEDDMKALGLKEGDRVKVTTEFGSVVLYVKKSVLDLPKGIVMIPLGIYANRVLPSESGTGTPLYKCIKCKVEKTDEEVLPIEKIVEEVIR
jgi:formylmethanofuran dehydrogenase subunit D